VRGLAARLSGGAYKDCVVTRSVTSIEDSDLELPGVVILERSSPIHNGCRFLMRKPCACVNAGKEDSDTDLALKIFVITEQDQLLAFVLTAEEHRASPARHA
jgi:hypothetical protein